MSEKLTIAGVQMDVAFADKETNLARIEDRLREAARHGARLAVFPECAVTGYCFESLEEARALAEPISGPSARRLEAACRESECFAVVGTIEADGPRIFNVCVLVGPQGLSGVYRKIHLPHLGLDNFSTPGDRPFQLWQAAGLKLARARVARSTHRAGLRASGPAPSAPRVRHGAAPLLLPSSPGHRPRSAG